MGLAYAQQPAIPRMPNSVDATPQRGRVLLLGAGGFIGGFITAALHRAGWDVVAAVRQPRQDGERRCDLRSLLDAADWPPLLAGVTAVVNAAGLLRDGAGGTLAQVHEQAPLACAQACVAQGINVFVQVSALGEPADGEFIASKHRFDAALLALPLRAVVLRPSVIYSTAGSYGGTSLLRSLAAFPGRLPLPGDGRWKIQPAAAEDLAALVVAALEKPARGIYAVGAPEPMTLRDYQQAWRCWLRIPGSGTLRTPEFLIDAVVAVSEWLGRGPLGAASWRLLRRGVDIAPAQRQRLQEELGMAPRSLAAVLAQQPSQVQDRWQAQLYLLAPILRGSVVVLWLISAVAGFVTPAAQIEQLAAGSWLAQVEPVALARAAALADLLLAAWLVSGWRPRAAIAAMLLLLGGYTLAFGLGLPALWLDPLGGLAKNLVLLPALAVLWLLSERR